jgi:hypothetical protein
MLEGLGEPIRETREFVKDLWWRNHDERRLGKLKFEEQKMLLVARHEMFRLTLAEKELQLREQYGAAFDDAWDSRPPAPGALTPAHARRSDDSGLQLPSGGQHPADE